MQQVVNSKQATPTTYKVFCLQHYTKPTQRLNFIFNTASRATTTTEVYSQVKLSIKIYVPKS